MALSSNENEWLEDFFNQVEGDPSLSDFERNFIGDQIDRYKQYGAEMRLSSKQWQVMFRTANKFKIAIPDGHVLVPFEPRR